MLVIKGHELSKLTKEILAYKRKENKNILDELYSP